MENFCQNVAQMFKEDTSDQQLFLKEGYNVFIIGFKQSGKSTLANVLSDQKQLDFSKIGNLFEPLNKNYFQIICQEYTGTKQPNSIIYSDYQIWDFPGYGMGEDAYKEIENRIQQIVTINKCKASHIVIVFPYSQFSQDRGENVIKISNLIADSDVTASIIISKVPPKVKLQTLVDKILSQLDQEENNYTEKAKIFLSQIIQNKRILLLPTPQLIDEKYSFNQNNVQQIKYMVLNKNYFQKLIIQFRYIPSDKIKVDEFVEQLQNNLKMIDDKLIKNQIKLNIFLIQPQLSNEEQLQCTNKEYKQIIESKNMYVEQYKQFQQIFGPQEWNQKSQQQINYIQDFFYEKHVQIINNQLHITCTKFDLCQLIEIFSKNENIQEIYIYSLHYVSMSSDIELPGVQIYIKCKHFGVNKKCLINLKGQPGQPFKDKARSGNKNNIHGDVGQVGNQGQSGGIIYVDAEEYFQIELLTIDISGGDGGRGQDGGDGYEGTKGADGSEEEIKLKQENNEIEKMEVVSTNYLLGVFSGNNKVSLYYYRSKGQAGSLGGNAGCGGKGGLCGDEGIIKFQNFNGQINQISNQSKQGTEGADGQPGQGGQFGSDYIGLFQDVKFQEIIRKPEQLNKQITQDKQEQQNLTEQQEIKQNNLNQTHNGVESVGQAIGGDVGVGVDVDVRVGIEAQEVGIQARAKQGVEESSTLKAFAILDVKLIDTGADLILRQGWNYIKIDQESILKSEPGQINKQDDNNLKQTIQDSQLSDIRDLYQLRLKYFIQFQKEKINQITEKFRQLSLSEEQISQIFGKLQ